MRISRRFVNYDDHDDYEHLHDDSDDGGNEEINLDKIASGLGSEAEKFGFHDAINGCLDEGDYDNSWRYQEGWHFGNDLRPELGLRLLYTHHDRANIN